MNREIFVLREVVTKVTQLLAGQGIEVTQRGAKAYVKSDPRTSKPISVNVPHIPDNASESLIRAIQGFIDHEVAHLLFTDFKAVSEANKKGKRLGRMHNIVEDTFIERRMAEKFKGSGYNLDNVWQFVVDDVIRPQVEKAKASGDSKKVASALMVPLFRAHAGQQAAQDLIDQYAEEVAPLEKRLKPILEKLPTAKTSWDCLDIAQGALKALKDEEEPPAQSSEGDSDEDQDDSDDKDQGEDDGKGSKSKSDDQGDASDDDNDGDGAGEDDSDEDSAGGSGDENQDQDQDGDGAGSANSEDDDDDQEDSGADAGEDSADDGESSNGGDADSDDAADDAGSDAGSDDAAEDAGDSSGDGAADDGDSDDDGGSDDASGAGAGGEDDGDAGEDDRAQDDQPGGVNDEDSDEFGENIVDDATDYDEAAASKISDYNVDFTKGASYRIYSKDWDRVATYRPSSKPNTQQLEDDTRHHVGVLQKEIERMMAARSRVHYHGGRRSGKVHGAALHKLVAGHDDRVFRKREEIKSKATAVELVIDCSGSMHGDKIKLACEAGYALSLVLERIKVPHEVIGFTTLHELHNALPSDFDGQAIQAEANKLGIRYSRLHPLHLPIFKGFQERLTPTVTQRFVAMPNQENMLAENVDGESIEIAAQRLLQRREERKIMMVLSDGMPAAHPGDMSALQKHLRDTVKNVERAGIETVGIGIMDSSVKAFYPKSLVINSLDELPGAVVGQLRKLLS